MAEPWKADEVYARFLDSLHHARPEHHRAPGIHASELSKCQRSLMYTMLGTAKVENIPTPWRLRFRVGQAIHDFLQEDLQLMAQHSEGMVDIACEVPIAPHLQTIAAKWGIHSSADAVLTFYRMKTPEEAERDFVERGDTSSRVETGKLVVEIKSKAPDSFDKMKKPEMDHIIQAHVYMACLGIDQTWFMYWNKGNQNITPSSGPYLMKFDPAIWKDIETVMQRAWELFALCKDGENVAKREEGIDCEFCGYSYTCQPDYLNKRPKGRTLPVVRE